MNPIVQLLAYLQEETKRNIRLTIDKQTATNIAEQLKDGMKPCPEPTQDIDLNLENRQKAINEYMYGPADPSNPGNFWEEIALVWKEDDLNEVKSMRCGNCAAFNVTTRMKKCIEKGFDDPGEDDMDTVEAGELGYCQFLNFKCAAKRTCKAWVTGGPIKDQSKPTT